MPRSMYCIPVLVLCVISGCSDSPEAARKKDIARLQSEVTEISKAQVEGNADRVIKSMPPSMVQESGGAGAIEAKMKGMMAAQQAMQVSLKLESVTFPSEPTFLTGDKNEYVVVPTITIIAGGKQRMQTTPFYFGMRAKGTKPWYVVNGPLVSQQPMLSKIAPDFPADYQFPKFEHKAL